MPEASTFLFHIFGIGVTLTDIASVATAISVFIGILQLSASRRVRVENAKRSAVKEAVEIAKLFQRDLIVNMSFVTSICDKTGLSSYTKEKIPDDKPLEFTREEATSYCGCDSQQKLEEFEKKTTPEILNQAAFFNPKYTISTDQKNGKTEDNDINEVIDFRNKIFEYTSTMGNTFNKLEWIAMLINSKVADGNVIYQSLHQVFLDFIYTNYLQIATKNSDTNACDQYYTNLIILYNNWVQKCEKQRCQECRRLKEAEKRNRRNRKKSIVHVPRM